MIMMMMILIILIITIIMIVIVIIITMIMIMIIIIIMIILMMICARSGLRSPGASRQRVLGSSGMWCLRMRRLIIIAARPCYILLLL